MIDLNLGFFIATIFGAIAGSYSTLFIYRIPIEESCFGRYFGPKSRCPNCNKIIRTRELIPIINWFFTKGKCVNCKILIPKRYLITEISSVILYIFCYYKFGFSENFILHSLLLSIILILAVTEWNFKIFFDPIIYAFFTISLVIRVLKDGQIIDLFFYIAFAIFLSAIFYKFLQSKLLFNKVKEQQILQYCKFLIICSILLTPTLFLLYFILILIFLSLISYLYKKFFNKDVEIGFYMIILLLITLYQ